MALEARIERHVDKKLLNRPFIYDMALPLQT